MAEQDDPNGDDMSEPAMPQRSEHVAHYPLDIELPSALYEHRSLGARDLMVHRIMADFMSPSLVKPHTYNAYIAFPAEFDPINAQNQQLGMDLKVMRKLSITSHYQDPEVPGLPQLYIPTFEFSRSTRILRSRDKPVAGPPTAPPTIGDEVLDLVQRYYFETDGAIIRSWLERMRPPELPTGPGPRRNGHEQPRIAARNLTTSRVKQHLAWAGKSWQEKDTGHLQQLDNQLAAAESRLPGSRSLYKGGSHLALVGRRLEHKSRGERPSRLSLGNLHYTIADRDTGPSLESILFWDRSRCETFDFYIQPRWCDRRKFKVFCKASPSGYHQERETGRGRPNTRSFGNDHRRGRVQRSRSEPQADLFSTAYLPEPRDPNWLPGMLMVMFPRLPLSTLDRRSRRRSLSRSHVANMLDWDSRDLKTFEDIQTETGALAQRVLYLRQRYSSTKPTSTLPEIMPTYPPCANCRSLGHPVAKCKQPCGYCGAPNPRNSGRYFGSKMDIPQHARPPPHIIPPPGNSEDEILQQMMVRVGEDSTLINVESNLGVIDDITVSPGGRLEWQRVGGTRDRVIFCPFVAAVPGVEHHVGDWDDDSANEEQEPFYPVVPHGVGKHGFPHTADKCPVPKTARCKCVAFPQYHVAARCRVKCSRDCGNPKPRGKWGHRNAMGCKSRCCMCGLRGHSGTECRLKRCRCGGTHLGQDCRFKVECRVDGCARFLCGVHCRSCGGTEKPFVGWECGRCRGVKCEEVEGEKTEMAATSGGSVGGSQARGAGEMTVPHLTPLNDIQAKQTPIHDTTIEEKTEYRSLFGGCS